MANSKTEAAHLEAMKGKRLTKREAAEYLGVGQRTIERWCGNGRLHGEKVGHFALYEVADIEALKRELAAMTTHKGRRTPYGQA